MTAEEIRSRHLELLRSLWRKLPKLQQQYSTFSDAPVETWRAGIAAVAEKVKAMPDAKLDLTRGSYTFLRNLVADQMGLPRLGVDSAGGGHSVLNLTW